MKQTLQKHCKSIAGVAVAAMVLAGCGDYADGVRVGTIQKFSLKGFISKTWEGEMLLGGLKQRTTASTDANNNTSYSTSMVANTFEFTVEDPELVKKAQAYAEQGVVVRAYYRQEIITHPWRTSTGVFKPYFLTRIEPAT